MLRWMSGVTRENRTRNEYVRGNIGAVLNSDVFSRGGTMRGRIIIILIHQFYYIFIFMFVYKN